MVGGRKEEKPFVTIGVTTFKRHDLLHKALDSVLAQTFTNFEVIVGNDYTEEILTGEMLGITDPRVRFVNHPHNLREVGNMNALLGMAQGRYFTWLFDDDLYEANFLQTAYDCLTNAGFPDAFFCSYRVIMGNEEFQPQEIQHSTMTEFTGRKFLRWYSAFRTRLLPTYGLFDTLILRNRLIGFDELSDSAIGIYSEYLFLVKCALLDRILYIDAPYYIYRQHQGSWSESNTDLEIYQIAGREYIRRASEVLRQPNLADDYNENLLKVCCFHLIEFAFKSGRYVNYISESAREKFGTKGAFLSISKHWHETSKTKKLYRRLGGEYNLRCRMAFTKVFLFCNYLMITYLARYFLKRKNG